MGKLIFLDIDGTITMPGKSPSSVVMKAIRQARRNGHMVFISTGRAICNIDASIMDIGFDGGIFHAGGRVFAGNQEIVNAPLLKDQTQMIIDILQKLDVTFYLETAGRQFASKAKWMDFAVDPSKASTELLRQILQRKQLNSRQFIEYRGEPVYKVSIMSHISEQRERIAERLPEWGKLVWFDNLLPGSPIVAGEISDKAVSKATAMAEICKFFSLDSDDCIAFGDSMNDAEIMQAAGIGVAMGNSSNELKCLADRVCESCDEDGIAKEFKRLSLI